MVSHARGPAATRTPKNMNRELAVVTIAENTWLEYDFDHSVTICRSLPQAILTVSLNASQAVGAISGISDWLVTFFDSKADRPERHLITRTLWVQDINKDDRLTLVSTRYHGQKERVEIEFVPRDAAKTAAALAGWLQARPSWNGKGNLPAGRAKTSRGKHRHYLCPVDCAL